MPKQKPKIPLSERIVDAELRCNRWLADGNAAREAGDMAEANACYAKSKLKDTIEPDVHPLLGAATQHMFEASTPAEVWEVGDTWVRLEKGEIAIGPDEPATYEQLSDLLIGTNGKAQKLVDE